MADWDTGALRMRAASEALPPYRVSITHEPWGWLEGDEQRVWYMRSLNVLGCMSLSENTDARPAQGPFLFQLFTDHKKLLKEAEKSINT